MARGFIASIDPTFEVSRRSYADMKAPSQGSMAGRAAGWHSYQSGLPSAPFTSFLQIEREFE
jgi:hypothetical protein